MVNKLVAFAVVTILVVAVIAVGVLYWQQTNNLTQAQDEITTLENNVSTLEENVSTLEENVSTLERNVSTLEAKLTESEAMVASLETGLEAANANVSKLQSDVSTQQKINSTLTDQLKKVQDLRHFESLTELVDWLHKDDTDTKYKNENSYQISFILQVRALRDGYLLPVSFSVDGGVLYVSNTAIIGEKVYYVFAWDDHTDLSAYQTPLPSHVLPMDQRESDKMLVSLNQLNGSYISLYDANNRGLLDMGNLGT